MILSFRTKPPFNTDSVYIQGLIQENLLQMNFKTTKYMLGSTEKAVFLGQRPYGAVFCLSDEETTVIVVQEQNHVLFKEEEETKLLLIDYDFEKKVYYGSMEKNVLKSGMKKYQKQKTRVPIGTISTTIQILGHASSSLNHVCIAFEDSKSSNLKLFGLLQITDFYCPYRTLENPYGHELVSKITKAKVIASPTTTRQMGIFSELYVLEPVLEDDLSIVTKKNKKSTSTVEGEEEIALPKYTNSKELELGQQVTGRIIGIKEDSLEIKLKTCKKIGKVMANVSIVDVEYPLEAQHPLDQFSINQRITGVIIGAIEKGINQRKPVSKDNPVGFRSLHLSLRTKDQVNGTNLQRVDWIEEGPGLELLKKAHTNKKPLEGVIVELNQENVVIRLSHRVSGICHVVELSEDIEVLKDFASFFPVGKRVQVYVLNYDVTKKHADLSLIRPFSTTMNTPLPGQLVHGMINRNVPHMKPPCVMIQLGAHTFGRACITELLPQEEWKINQHTLDLFAHGKMFQALVLNCKQGIEVSLRSDALSLRQKYIQEYTYQVGQMVHGFVVSTSNSGCFIKLQGGHTARVLLRELSDDFIKDPIDSFPSGKVVVGRITKINPTNQRIEMSLKKSTVSEDTNQFKWTNLKEGMNVKGHITRIQKYGVFVKIVNSTISGLCHLSEISDNKITPEALSQVFNEGDYVKAKILKIEDRRISFGLKPSYFENDTSSESESESEEEEEVEQMEVDDAQEVEKHTKSESDSSSESEEEEKEENIVKESIEGMEVDDYENDQESDSEEEEEEEVVEEDTSKTQAIDFIWDGFSNFDSTATATEFSSKKKENEETSEDEESDAVSDSENKIKNKKKTTKKQQDEWISLREKALSSGESVPQTPEDYERLLAINPQSSYLWIQYMAFHVSMTEIQLARDVAIRATSTISFSQEKEKLNVWLAYLNLEHDFSSNGQDDDNFLRVFKTACQVNPPKNIYLHLVDLYTRSNEFTNAESTLFTMQKKFNTSKQIWVRSLKFYVETLHNLQKAAEILQKSFKSLPKYKHLFVICKYGQFLYEFDSNPEKARIIFEGILSNYPKRIDLWNVYLDKEIKFGSIEMARHLFERLIAMDFSAKKMKFLFKKFLQFEKQYGTNQRVEHVKQLATEFVEQAAATN